MKTFAERSRLKTGEFSALVLKVPRRWSAFVAFEARVWKDIERKKSYRCEQPPVMEFSSLRGVRGNLENSFQLFAQVYELFSLFSFMISVHKDLYCL